MKIKKKFTITLLPTSVFAEGTEESGIKIVFDNSKTNWGNVKIHYWGGKSASNWPGVDMEPVEGKDAVYSFDYAPVKFIVLNLETAKTDEESRENQKDFLEKEVNKAKKAG